MTGQLPAFMRRPAPLSKAIDAIERGIARRSARVWAPRWVGPMLLARGIVQPLNERLILRDTSRLSEGMRLAAIEDRDEDPILGVSAEALRAGPGRARDRLDGLAGALGLTRLLAVGEDLVEVAPGPIEHLARAGDLVLAARAHHLGEREGQPRA